LGQSKYFIFPALSLSLYSRKNVLIMTKTAIISFDSNDKSIRKIIEGLVSMGVITFEEYPYNQAMVEKIKRGDQAIKEGKGIIINPTELNIFC